MTDQGVVVPTISTADAVRLYQLKLRWDGRYHVSLTEGTRRAIRDTDALAVLTAATGDELAELINADYGDWTVYQGTDLRWRARLTNAKPPVPVVVGEDLADLLEEIQREISHADELTRQARQPDQNAPGR